MPGSRSWPQVEEGKDEFWRGAECGDNVRNLCAIRRLKILVCRMVMGAEDALVDLCRTSPLLNVSKFLGWSKFGNIVLGSALRLLPRVVEATPNLANLALLYISISSAELKAVLSSVGLRLESLEISTGVQEEKEADRLMTILETVLERNCNLRKLCVHNTHTTPRYGMNSCSPELFSRLLMLPVAQVKYAWIMRQTGLQGFWCLEWPRNISIVPDAFQWEELR